LLDGQIYGGAYFGFSGIYYKIMGTDAQRVNAFNPAFVLNNNFKDATVCESNY